MKKQDLPLKICSCACNVGKHQEQQEKFNYYEYNKEGLPIEKPEVSMDFKYQEKFHYTYCPNGNLKSIRNIGDYKGSVVFNRYVVKNLKEMLKIPIYFQRNN